MNQQAIVLATDNDMIKAVKNVLSQLHIVDHSVDNVIQTVEALRREPSIRLLIIDLAVQDDRMLELVQSIRRGKYKDMLILALVDLDEQDKLREMLKAGVNRYITKVFITGSLKETLIEMTRV